MSDSIDTTSNDDFNVWELSEDENRQVADNRDSFCTLWGSYSCPWCDDTDSVRSIAGSSCDDGEQQARDVCSYHPHSLRNREFEPMHPQTEDLAQKSLLNRLEELDLIFIDD